LVALLGCLAFSIPSLSNAATARDVRYLDALPEPAQVLRDYTDRDPEKAFAMQYSAMVALNRAIEARLARLRREQPNEANSPAALAEARQGKRTLRSHAVEYKPVPKVTPKELIRVRESLNISRALFAVYLRTNVRTLENWEQGRAKPNAQAALLINLVKRYPDTVQRLATI
jgi:putative transcriptional regulator